MNNTGFFKYSIVNNRIRKFCINMKRVNMYDTTHKHTHRISNSVKIYRTGRIHPKTTPHVILQNTTTVMIKVVLLLLQLVVHLIAKYYDELVKIYHHLSEKIPMKFKDG